MVHKFFAILWDSACASQNEAAAHILERLAARCTQLTKVLQADGFAFLVADAAEARSRLHVLPNDQGLVFGTLFRRERDLLHEDPHERAMIGADETAKIIASGGGHLVSHYWGHYVTVLLGASGSPRRVFRSPNCHQSCLYACFNGVHLYFSNANDCANLGVMKFSINWDFVSIFAACGRVHCAETGLNEMLELQCGEFHELRDHSVSSGFLWNPVNIACSGAIDDPDLAKKALRASVRACVASWATQHQRIVQRLSGGIDSSIVTACLRLARSQPDVTCVNYFSRGTYGDERKYARQVANKNGFPLIEYPQNTGYSLQALLDFPKTASPLAHLIRIECDSREVALARERNATARFTGNMGDILFQMPPMTPVATEYLQRNGLDTHFLKIALHTAQMDRVSLWRVLRCCISEGIIRRPETARPGEFDGQEVMLLTADAAKAFTTKPLRFVHPWLHSVKGVPAGKFAQLSCLGANSSYFNCLHEETESEWIHPLLSEPLVEVCLRIPAYLLMHSGWDRTMAREAFANELPEAVRNRVTKGAMTLWVREMIANNAHFIRELLMNGILVREGIIDRARLDAALPGKATRSELPIGCLLDCVAAEAWCSAWRTQAALRAAA